MPVLAMMRCMKKQQPATTNAVPEVVTVKEMYQHIGALHEEFLEKMAALGEQYGGIVKRLVSMQSGSDDRFDRLEQKVDRMDARHDVLVDKVDALQGDVMSIKLKVDRIEGKQHVMQEYIHVIKTDFKKKVTYDELHTFVQPIVQRVTKLEQKVR